MLHIVVNVLKDEQHQLLVLLGSEFCLHKFFEFCEDVGLVVQQRLVHFEHVEELGEDGVLFVVQY